MAVNYTTLPVQFGALLKIFRKREALSEQIRLASASTHDRRLLVAANGFSTSQTDEARVLGSQISLLDNEQLSAIRGMMTTYKSRIESVGDFFGLLADDLAASSNDRARGAIRYAYDNVAGAISIVERQGILGSLYRDMIAGDQRVTANGVTFGSFTAGSANRGLLTVTSMTGLSHMLSGTLVFEVVSESVDNPTLSVQLDLTNPLPDGTTIVRADNLLTAEESFEDGPTGLTCVLTRSGLATPTENGDNGNIFSATSFATPSASDASGGVYQVRVTRQAVAPIWLVEVFQDTDRNVKVGSTTTDGTVGTVALTITCRGGSVMSTTFSKANANTLLVAAGNTDDDITFDIETPRIGDRWTRSVTNDEVGNFSTKIAKLWRITLPTSGANLWTDALAASESFS